MNIKINFIDNLIELKEDSVFSVECINKAYFYRIINIFNDIYNGESNENITFTNGNEEINLNNKISIFYDYFNYNLSLKKLQSKLLDKLIDEISDEDRLALAKEYNKVYSLVKKNLIKLDSPYEIENQFDLEDMLKLFNYTIVKKDSVIENILNVLDVEIMFNLNKLIVFVNLKSYLSNEELNELYKYAIYNKIQILFIDSSNYGVCLENGHKLIIDSNLEEVLL